MDGITLKREANLQRHCGLRKPSFFRLPWNKRTLSVLGLTLFIVLTVQQFSIGGEDTQGQIDVLKSIVEQNKSVQAFWDNTWQITFHPDAAQGQTGLADYVFINISRIFLLIGIIALLWKLATVAGSSMNGSSDSVVSMFRIAIPAMIIFMLAANNSIFVRDALLGTRQYFNNAKNGILQARITEITIAGAMKDVFATQSSSLNIAKEIMACDQMPHPNVYLPSAERPTDPEVIARLSPEQVQAYDYLKCMEFIPNIIQEQLDNNVKAVCGDNIVSNTCAYLTRSLNNQNDTFLSAIKKEKEKVKSGGWFNPFFFQSVTADFIGGLVTKTSEKQLYNTIQYWAASFLEAALFIDALFAPLALYIALVPGRLNFFMGWVISILTFCVAQIANVVTVGFAALQMSQSATYFLSDTRFEFALGVTAPLLALSVVGGGGIMAIRTFMGANLAAAGAVTQVVGSIASSITMGISRAVHQRR